MAVGYHDFDTNPQIMSEIRQAYDGPVELATDYMVFNVTKDDVRVRMAAIAELLKNHGYVSGQFGKNHLGNQDPHLPTAHGFDEFFGNIYLKLAMVITRS